VNIIYRKNVVIYICGLVGCNENNIKMDGICIKVIVHVVCQRDYLLILVY